MSDAGKPEAAPLAPEVQKRVEALHEVQGKVEEQYKAYLEERKALEKKYQEVYQGLFKERAAIVSGETDPANSTESKGIPKFWMTAFQNHRAIASYIEDQDEEALSFLNDVTSDYIDDFNGFKLSFHFAPNPYFENAVLTKTVHMPGVLGRGTLGGSQAAVEKTEGCEINWKEGKNLTVKEIKKTVRRNGKKKTVTKEEAVPSFFRFFETVDMEALENMDEEDQEEAMAMVEQFQAEMDVSMAIFKRIIPDAVNWFSGEAVDSDDEEEEDGDYDEEEDEDFEEEEEEEEEEAPKARRGKGAQGKKAKKADEEEDEEEGELANAFAKGANVSGDNKPADGAAGAECKQQ